MKIIKYIPVFQLYLSLLSLFVELPPYIGDLVGYSIVTGIFYYTFSEGFVKDVAFSLIVMNIINAIFYVTNFNLKLSTGHKYNLLLTLIICVLAWKNYDNTELFRNTIQSKNNRVDECFSRLDSLNMSCSKEIIQLQKKAHADQITLYKEFEVKYKELYDRTNEVIKKYNKYENRLIELNNNN